VKVLLDLTQDENMRKRGTAREIVNRIQKLRKGSSLHPDDDVIIFVKFKEGSASLQIAFDENKLMMENILKKPFNLLEKKPHYLKVAAQGTFDYEGEHFDVEVCWNNLVLNKQSVEVRILSYKGLTIFRPNIQDYLKRLKKL